MLDVLRRLGNARVGKEDVEASPRGERLFDDHLIVGGPRDVGAHGERLTPGLLDLLDRGLGAGLVHVHHDHARPFLRHRQSRSRADARARSSDHRDPAVESHPPSPDIP